MLIYNKALETNTKELREIFTMFLEEHNWDKLYNRVIFVKDFKKEYDDEFSKIIELFESEDCKYNYVFNHNMMFYKVLMQYVTKLEEEGKIDYNSNKSNADLITVAIYLSNMKDEWDRTRKREYQKIKDSYYKRCIENYKEYSKKLKEEMY